MGAEGYWPYTGVPAERIAADTGVVLTKPWLDRLEQATVRVGTTGTSGAFVSSRGLILTARHVIPAGARGFIEAELKNGFAAPELDSEVPLPDVTIDALVSERDVTATVLEAAIPGAAAAGPERRAAVIAELERTARAEPGSVGQVVSYYGGAKYVLFTYHRYTDVRLAFAPESALAAETGAYPAPTLDIALVRAYEAGMPAQTPNYLRVSREHPVEGMPIFISGAPYAGGTRWLPAAGLRSMQSIDVPLELDLIGKASTRASAWRDRAGSSEPVTVKTVKLLRFYRELLDADAAAYRDPAFVAARVHADQQLRTAPPRVGGPHSLAALLQAEAKVDELDPLRRAHLLLPWSGDREPIMWQDPDADVPWAAYVIGPTLTAAEVIVRIREEIHRPDAERAEGYRDAERARLEHWLLDGCETGCLGHTESGLEVELLTAYLETLGENLPSGDSVLLGLLGGQEPRERARQLIGGSRLGDAVFRRRLYLASDAEFATTHDPVLDAVRAIQGDIRWRGQEYDARSSALSRAESELDTARYAALGPTIYPDTTGTFRLGYGLLRSYERSPQEPTMSPSPWFRLPAVSTAEVLYDYGRHQDHPLLVPDRWRNAESTVRTSVALDFLSDVDGVAGNSGSITVDRNGDVIGVLFGGVGGADVFRYVYEGKLSSNPERSIHSAVEGLLEALDHVYRAPRLFHELTDVEPK
ncbi:MAG: S46 family peptidase [Proteobacteria bacterium]|nr:S46 family peptidase [Pseudomonadota bacterium]